VVCSLATKEISLKTGLLIFALLGFLLAVPVGAHNGAVAIAVPIDGITIDGDLSDWPPDMVRYWLYRQYGRPLEGSDDFSGSFRVGYNPTESALYVAVEIADDAVVQHTEGGPTQGAVRWHTQESNEIYLEATHADTALPPTHSYLWGSTQGGSGPNETQATQVEVAWGKTRIHYEWRLDLSRLLEGPLQPGQTLGFDITHIDHDGDPWNQTVMSWGKGSLKKKYSHSDQLGDLLLASRLADSPLGLLTGQVRTEGKDQPFADLFLQAYRDGEPSAITRTGPGGTFSLPVTPGTYTLQPLPQPSLDPIEMGPFAVPAGRAQPIDLPVPGPGALTGRITARADGRPLAALPLAVYRDGLWAQSAHTDTAGHYRFGPLAPGKYVVRVRQSVQPAVLDTLVLDPDEQVRANFAIDHQPTQVQLDIEVDPGQLEAFATAYQTDLVPILARHGLQAAPFSATAGDSTRILQLQCTIGFPDQLSGILTRLKADSSYTALVQRWREDFSWDDSSPNGFHLNRTAAGLGRTVRPGPGTRQAISPGTRQVPRGRRGTAGSGTRQGAFHTLNVTDGLVANTVLTMLQDSRGELWFGTEGGLSRYDGERFTNYTAQDGLERDWVLSSLEDSQGRLWFGTGRAGASGPGVLICVDGQTFADADLRFTAFAPADGLPHAPVRAMAEDLQGRLWFGTWGGGLVRYDGDSFTTFTTQDGLGTDFVTWLQLDQAGRLWINAGAPGPNGTRGFTVYDGATFTHFTKEDGLPHNRVITALQDRLGRLWFSAEGQGLSRFDGDQIVNLTAADGLLENWLYSLLEDRRGDLWIGAQNGLSRYDGERFTHFTKEDGQAALVRCMLEDREGNLWVGTGYFGSGAGVSRYDPQFTTFTTADGLGHDRVLALLEDASGDLWLGTGAGSGDGEERAGLSRFDSEHFTNFTTQDGLAFSKVAALLQDRTGALWLGHGAWAGLIQGEVGLGRYDGRQFTYFTTRDSLVNNFVETLLEDEGGALWIGTQHGLSRYDGETFTNFTTGQGLPHDRIQALLQDQNGAVWIGTQHGLSRYHGGIFTNFTTQDGLAHNDVLTLLQDRHDNLWIGTQNGLSRGDSETLSGADLPLTNFTTQDGLSGSQVTALTQTQDGHLWIGTLGGGATQYDGLVFQTLSRQDGLADDRVHDILADRHGDLWFATETGLTRYQPHRTPPPVRITEVFTDRSHGPVQHLDMPSWQGSITFEFTGQSYKTRRDQIAFVYRLVGHDKEWRWTRQRRITYTDLPEGSYTFEVKAVDRDLTYSETPASVELTVLYQPLVSPVRIAAIQLDDLFASFYKSYADQPVGTTGLINDGADSAHVTLSFILPDLMPRRSEQSLVIPPRSSQAAPLYASLDNRALAVQESMDTQAEIALAFEVGDEVISIQKKAPLTLYGRGALTWDKIDRAAAFVTSTDPAVTQFARSLLRAFESELDGQGPPIRNLTRALILFEALKQHGLRYAADPNTPYSQVQADRAAVDHIQYPAQLLHSKAGDCDDLTVLYSSLLEAAGIATALVDYPGHIFLLFDTGVRQSEIYQLPLATRHYLLRGDRVWMPVEITRIDQSFYNAWQAGLDQLSTLSAWERRRRIVDTQAAWQQYPATAPTFEYEIEQPNPETLAAPVAGQVAQVRGLIDKHIADTYLYPLERQPDNDGLRTELLKMYLALGQTDQAIDRASDDLLDERGNKGATLVHLGNAYRLKGNLKQAAWHYKQAVGLRPDDQRLQKHLNQVLESLGRVPLTARVDSVAVPAVTGAKAGMTDLEVEDLYWIE